MVERAARDVRCDFKKEFSSMNLRVELLTGGIGRPAEPSLSSMMDSQRETEGRRGATKEAASPLWRLRGS